ncbi:MAG: hypothetical protein AVDCRST_MAG21-688 [uncultured Nocardioidaceae bacterium]|uniref:Peptidyl-prolyl cis-trans isomerase n=1 Tax=uncultured Nocardioidaceae bacterium TaxID=253824 RepID=A0A6J4MVR8_9ACTN|nr:MAG: hypothetical protein AVDCRST_MAG21-688 [uncultured Nocardioidaceae bacterium]
MSSIYRPSQPDGRRSTPRGTRIVVAAVVLLCVAALVATAVLVGGDDDTDTQTSSPNEQTPTSPVSSATAGECSEPPQPPAEPETYSEPPDPALAEGATWNATVTTNCGDIQLELYGDKAPQTVASFLQLGRDGYYDDSPCHRLTTQGIFVLQCGDPTGTGTGNPGYGYGIENAPPDGNYPTGTLAMARGADPNSNGGQFFIVHKDTSLPGGYSIFGQVTSGLEIVQAIAKEGVSPQSPTAGDGPPAQPISILDVSVEQA